MGRWVAESGACGGDANDPCKHYHPSLSQSIYQGGPGALLGASLPQIQFYAETHASGGYAIMSLRKTKIT